MEGMSSDEQPQDHESTKTRVVERIKHPLEKGSSEMRPEDLPGETAPEDVPNVPGAEGGSRSEAADALPGLPADDSSALGDTDQHSDA
jgi:hypothetical protein